MLNSTVVARNVPCTSRLKGLFCGHESLPLRASSVQAYLIVTTSAALDRLPRLTPGGGPAGCWMTAAQSYGCDGRSWGFDRHGAPARRDPGGSQRPTSCAAPRRLAIYYKNSLQKRNDESPPPKRPHRHPEDLSDLLKGSTKLRSKPGKASTSKSRSPVLLYRINTAPALFWPVRHTSPNTPAL